MVFFTCNHCGESLKKPAVDKHYTWKACKNAPPFLTCVDCLKDFRGDEFRAHTKCITEDEKYSAKGFVAKAASNKGAQKQEAWTECIQAQLAQRKDFDDYTRRALERIAQQTNVPRKKPKFINFLKSSTSMSPNNAERIWAIVETALEEFTKKDAEAKAAAAAVRKAADDARIAAKKAAEEAARAAAGESVAEEVKPKKEKKSKKSKAAAAAESVPEVSSTTDADADATTTSKKDKKKKRKAEGAAADDETTTADDKKPKLEFEWKKEITAVLQKKSDIKLEKLRAKVLKRLAEHSGAAEASAKDEKKFAKHLEKLGKHVSVEGGTVKLVAPVE